MDLVALTALCAVALVLGVAVVMVVAAAARQRLEAELQAVRGELREVRSRLERLEEPSAARGPGDPAAGRDRATAAEYLITTLADEETEPAPSQMTSGQFASVAVGESLVRVASLAHGVRRALSAEQRNRIRFEMGREAKRSRRQRRRDVRAARRHLRQQAAGQAGGRGPGLAEDAA